MATRHNSKEPTPFIKSIKDKLETLARSASKPFAVDAGCGNGRNSEWLKSLGYEVLSIDLDSEYGVRHDLSTGTLPMAEADLVLLQFVLMFLPLNARRALVREAFDKARFVVVELYEAKTGFMSKEDIQEFLQWTDSEAFSKGFSIVETEQSKRGYASMDVRHEGGPNEKSVQRTGKKGK